MSETIDEFGDFSEVADHTDVRITETPEDIQVRRKEVLGHFVQFRTLALGKRDHIEDARLYQLFRDNADSLQFWIEEKLQSALEDSFKDANNLQSRLQRHKDFEAEVNAHSSVLEALNKFGDEMIEKDHFRKKTIQQVLDELNGLWRRLKNALEDKHSQMTQLLDLQQFMRECSEEQRWITEKESFVCDEVAGDLKGSHDYIINFEIFLKDLQARVYRIKGVNRDADGLIDAGHPEAEQINMKRNDLNEAWARLQKSASESRDRLFGAQKVQRFFTEVGETSAWIDEKTRLVKQAPNCRDLKDVQEEERRHDVVLDSGFERDLIAVEAKVEQLEEDVEDMKKSGTELPKETRLQFDELLSKWRSLMRESADRKRVLGDKKRHFAFQSEYRDVISWISEMKTVLSSEVQARDVASVEELISNHLEYKVEIESREDDYKQVLLDGEALIRDVEVEMDGSDANSRREIERQLDALNKEKEELDGLWMTKRDLYDHLLGVQLFNRDADQTENWLDRKKALLENCRPENNVEHTETEIKKLDGIEKDLRSNDGKMKHLSELAERIVSEEYPCDEVRSRCDRLLDSRGRLEADLSEKRKEFDDLLAALECSSDCVELIDWMNVRIDGFKNEWDDVDDYLTLRKMMLKLQTLQQEIKANTDRIEEVSAVGREVLPDVNEQLRSELSEELDVMQTKWTMLKERASLKDKELHHISEEFQLQREISEFENWISGCEGQLATFVDRIDVKLLESNRRQLTHLHSDYDAHRDTLEDIKEKVKKLEGAEDLIRRVQKVEKRFEHLAEPIDELLGGLDGAKGLVALIREVEDQISWIKEKKHALSSEYPARDLMSAQNSSKKHEALIAELDSRNPIMEELFDKTNQYIEQTDGDARENVEDARENLKREWISLQMAAEKKTKDLERAVKIHEFMIDGAEAVDWMVDKEPVVSSEEYGRDEDSTQVLLKRHKALVSDLKAFENTVKVLHDRVDGLEPEEEEENGATMVEDDSEATPGDLLLVRYAYKARTDRELSVRKGDVVQLVNAVNKDWWKVDQDGRVGFVPANYVRKLKYNDEATKVSTVRELQKNIEEAYDVLLDKAQERQKALENALKVFQLLRESAKIREWMNSGKAKIPETNCEGDAEYVDEILGDFDTFKTELKVWETRVAELNDAVKAVSPEDLNPDLASTLREHLNDVNTRFRNLTKELETREENLGSLQEAHAFRSDVAETNDWILDKEQILNSADVGHDVRSVLDLQRKHDALERELVPLGEKIRRLNDRAYRLRHSRPESAEELYDLQKNLTEEWNQLANKCNDRRDRLHLSQQYHSFVNDHRELMHWMKTQTGLVGRNETPGDLMGAEVLVEGHRDYKDEITAKENNVKEFVEFGDLLLAEGHPMSEDISKKLNELKGASDALKRAWQGRGKILEQTVNLHHFNREVEQTITWMNNKEVEVDAMMDGGGETEEVEVLLKGLSDVERIMQSAEDRVEKLCHLADTLLKQGHCETEPLTNKRGQLLHRWDDLREKLEEKRNKLDESHNAHKVGKGVEHTHTWIIEKLRIIEQVGCRAPSGDSTVETEQQLRDIEEEIQANKHRIESMFDKYGNMTDHSASRDSETLTIEKLETVQRQWEVLQRVARERTERVKNARRLEKFVSDENELNSWLDQIENFLQHDDCGKDLPAVLSLLRKHEKVEADIDSHGRSVQEIRRDGESIIECDSEAEASDIERRLRDVEKRYERLLQRASKRRADLEKSHNIHEFCRSIDQELSWIKEKSLLLSSDDFGRDVNGVLNLQRKHKRITSEVKAHEPVVRKSLERGVSLTHTVNDAAATEPLKKRCEHLRNEWNRLMTKASERAEILEKSEKYLRWMESTDEQLAVLGDREQALHTSNYGETMSSVQALLNKHKAFESDLQQHMRHVSELCRDGDELVRDCQLHEKNIAARQKLLQDRYKEVEELGRRRKARLDHHGAFMQYMWKCDSAETWICDREKELLARSADNGRDSGCVLDLITRHEAFESVLEAFEQDGLRKCEELKVRLSKHPQIEAVEHRFAVVMNRWKQLINEADKWKHQLVRAHEMFLRAEELHLLFATKASALNSWIENAEEDLTDPVRCNSVDEVRVLMRAHDDFKKRLIGAEKDYEDLGSLHQKITSLHMGPNPYAWFTMESVDENWRILLSIVQAREEELAHEMVRQKENDRLRKEFAHVANEFYQWLSSARQSMLEDSGSLEEQLEVTKEYAAEIKKGKTALRRVEEFGTMLEKNLILDNHYTEHSTVGLAQAFDNVDRLRMQIQHNLEQQIRARNECGVSEEALRDFTVTFKHFDKEQKNRLDHTQLRNCLCALGHNLNVDSEEHDPHFEHIINILDPNRDGYVSLQDYMTFLISCETENIESSEDMVDAFRWISKDNTPYVTRDDLFANLPPQQAEYCVRRMRVYKDPKTGRTYTNAFDFESFIRSLFQKHASA